MKCPACSVNLNMTHREGIEIDYCPTCRGVWLDRGELDKLIERSVAAEGRGERDERPREDWEDDDDRDSDDRPHTRRKTAPPPYRKREGFWSNLFDFD